ncbi:MAG: hypothetical protein GTO51_11185 [Candidatus Latescibacteria bacterium]|nr:hypothetical protein [Candidatus Latescibacterota bacterium]NIM66527.1 hypothetical protein [Candidatus Latescibacterota bacterium]NIO03007.1 hypothetical protein [Candidatus Latescibacterota bacterium]NIO30142.1 hypothetical protein [Candidatus Latescibacterota bacterium]NIO57761.1 hypothetical protein [Candidatus Latescibacterota bacterium]
MTKNFRYAAILFILPCILGFSSRASGQILSIIKADFSTISPNGDGSNDSTKLTYTLLDSVVSLDVIVFDSDTVSVVDTLISGEPRSAGLDSVIWNGEDSLGVVVAEDSYHILIRAQGISETDSAFITIIVDLTAPKAQVLSVNPGIFAPNLPDVVEETLRVSFRIWDSSEKDDLGVAFITPKSGEEISLKKDIPDFAGDGDYEVRWDEDEFDPFIPPPGQGQPDSRFIDGIYQAKLEIKDDGANKGSATAFLNFDLKAPSIEITDPSGTGTLSFRVIPDSILGWAYDRNGITEIMMWYDHPTSDSLEAPVQWTKNDTIFFSAPLADSIVEERAYTIKFRASDPAPREKALFVTIKLDTTVPPPPVLDPPAGVVHSRIYTLTGEAFGDTKWVRISRGGTLVDSAFTQIEPLFARDVPLEAGSNSLTGRAVDGAGNVSTISNAITVVYDPSPGLFIPTPFRPNDKFQINLAQPPVRVLLKIYDLGGDLVVSLEDRSASADPMIPWDGLNGERDAVKRGPLVAVAIAEYADGSKTAFREIFLFDP